MTPPRQIPNEIPNRPLLTQAYLQSVNKSAKLSLCPTPECPCTGITSSWNTKYFWGVDRTCSVCDSTWTICKECTLRSHYCTQKAKQTHHCTRHTVPIFLRMPSRKPTLRLDFFSVKKGLMRLFNNQPTLWLKVQFRTLGMLSCSVFTGSHDFCSNFPLLLNKSGDAD